MKGSKEGIKVNVKYLPVEKEIEQGDIVSTGMKDLFVKVTKVETEKLWGNHIVGYPAFPHVLYNTNELVESKPEECKVVRPYAFIEDKTIGEILQTSFVINNKSLYVYAVPMFHRGEIRVWSPICPCCGHC